jgi:hypothetical protein
MKNPGWAPASWISLSARGWLQLSDEAESFALRRSGGPYIGLATILVGVTGLMIFASLETNDWAPIASMSVGWFFFGVVIYIGTRYRVFWRGGTVVRKASGMASVSIRIDEITRIVQETSDARTWRSFRRPFRRITIYADKRLDEGRSIDVSLKHFLADDVRRLMRAIRDQRPDLKLPDVMFRL